MHFHAPIRTLVYLTLKCPSLYSIEISLRDLVFLLLFVDLFGIYSKWQRIGAFYVPNETLGRGVCIPHTLLVCVVYDPNDTLVLVCVAHDRVPNDFANFSNLFAFAEIPVSIIVGLNSLSGEVGQLPKMIVRCCLPS